jgi:hypothetical protein
MGMAIRIAELASKLPCGLFFRIVGHHGWWDTVSVKVLEREYPSVTSRPVVYLSVVPTISPDGMLGETRSVW